MRNHRKIKALKCKFGQIKGYAFWSMFIEYLTGLDGNEMEYSDIECEMFAGELGEVTATDIRSMIDYCISIELLFKNEANFIFSDSLNEYLNPVYEKRKREREKSKTRVRREGKFISNKTASDGITAAEKPQSKVKESKVHESKVNTIPETSSGQVFWEPKNEPICRKGISDKLYPQMIEAYNKFIIKNFDIKAKINSTEGKAMKEIIEYMHTGKNGDMKTEEQILKNWNYVLDNYKKWDKFRRENIKIVAINSNLTNIIKDIKECIANS
jgi:hypothetical protein